MNHALPGFRFFIGTTGFVIPINTTYSSTYIRRYRTKLQAYKNKDAAAKPATPTMNLLSLTNYFTPESSSSGKLTATILSAHDLPTNSSDDDEGFTNSSEGYPPHVSMIVLDMEVTTGPPSARHKERDRFKFVEDNDDVGRSDTGGLSDA